jgi:hypothetical protein
VSTSSDNPMQGPPAAAISRSSFWFVGVVAVLMFLLLFWYIGSQKQRTSAPAKPQIAASFTADFLDGKPKTNWRYMWNANGPISRATNYVDLVWNGSAYAAFDTPTRPQAYPAHYLRLKRGSGHPGHGFAQGAEIGNAHERFVIVGYSVSAAGRYWLTSSTILRDAGDKEGSLHVRVFVGDREVGHSAECRSRDAISFDRELGKLSAGDTIYVAVGPHEIDVNDGFHIDFALARGIE